MPIQSNRTDEGQNQLRNSKRCQQGIKYIYLLPIIIKDEQQIDRFYSDIIGKHTMCN